MKKKIGIVIVLLLIVGAVVGVFWYLNHSKDSAAAGGAEVVDWDVDVEDDSGGTGEGILIPGYDTVTMDADANILHISIGNPKDNSCYFKVQIVMEDGTKLYESELLAPGKGVNEISCENVPEKGTYQAVATFQCFQDEEETVALNGADSSFKLIVE